VKNVITRTSKLEKLFRIEKYCFYGISNILIIMRIKITRIASIMAIFIKRLIIEKNNRKSNIPIITFPYVGSNKNALIIVSKKKIPCINLI